jgi:outer membrane protein assembly factor BamB
MTHRISLLAWLAILFGVLHPSVALAGDWPQHLGPQRNGTTEAMPLGDDWRTTPPKQLWSVDVGAGFSGPVVAGSRLILAHRIEDEELVDAYDATTGERLWRSAAPADYQDRFGFNDGPRATPTIVGDAVYTLGAAGLIRCLDLATGQERWRVDTHDRFDVPEGFFGAATSPLIDGNRLLVNIGGRQAGIVALDTRTGQTLWTATTDEASYSSGIIATLADERLAVFFTRSGLRVVDPATGQLRYSFPWRARIAASVNAATPLVVGNEIFLSSSYNTGAVVLTADGNEVKPIWSGDRSLSNHYATSVYHNGYLYGFDGRQEFGPELRCVEWKSGQVMWSHKQPAGSLILAGDALLVLDETGQLQRLRPTSERRDLVTEAKLIDGTVRAFPALAKSVLYLRTEEGKLAAFDLR